MTLVELPVRSAELEGLSVSPSEKIRLAFPEQFRGNEYYLAHRYSYLVQNSSMSIDEKKSIQELSVDLLTTFDGKKRDSGVPAALHFFEVALQNFGEYYPKALTKEFLPIDDLTVEHPSLKPEKFCEYLSEVFGIENDQDFKVLVETVYLPGFERLKKSPGRDNFEAHCGELMHDRIEDDFSVKVLGADPEVVRHELEDRFGKVTAEDVSKLSFLKSKYSGKEGYIFELYKSLSERQIILFIKARDLLSNILTLNELQGRTKDGVYKSKLVRIREKAKEYSAYLPLLLEVRDPMSELIADLLFFLTKPELFSKEYQASKYYRRNSSKELPEIEKKFSNYLTENFPSANYRIENPGIYRSWRRKVSRNLNSKAACSLQFIVNCGDVDVLKNFSEKLSKYSFDKGEVQDNYTQSDLKIRNDFVEFTATMAGQYKICCVALSEKYEWIFSRFENDVFGNEIADHTNRQNLIDRTKQYLSTFTGNNKADLKRLIEEAGRNLIKIFIDDTPFWLPEDSSALDVVLRYSKVFRFNEFSALPKLSLGNKCLSPEESVFGENRYNINRDNMMFLNRKSIEEALKHDVFKTSDGKKFARLFLKKLFRRLD